MWRTALISCVVLGSACGRPGEGARAEPAAAAPPPIELPAGGVTMKVVQRTAAALPGSHDRVRVELGDITGGKVALSLARTDGSGVLAHRSVGQGDVVPFRLDGFGYRLVVARMENLLVGDDWVELRIDADDSAAAPAAPAIDQHARIEGLLAALAASHVVFIRNGSEHSPAEAADHLRSKWERAGDRVRTAEDFIEVLGSRSSQTGEAYRVRAEDGSEREAGPWLRELLAGVDAR